MVNKTVITYYQGCHNGRLSLNDNDFPEQLTTDMIHRILDLYPHVGHEILSGLIETLGSYEPLGYCEDCGDTPYLYTLELD